MGSKFFRRDGKFVQVFETVADLIVLNFLTILCSLPVITAGAALTAMYGGVFRLKRKEESYLVKDFFRDFKSNFKQSTIIWLLALALGVLIYLDYRIFSRIEGIGYALQIVAYAAGILVYFTVLYAIPLQSRFINPVKATIRNALSLWCMKPHYAIFVGLITALPIYLAMWFPMVLGVYILLGVSSTGWLCGFFFEKIFARVRIEE